MEGVGSGAVGVALERVEEVGVALKGAGGGLKDAGEERLGPLLVTVVSAGVGEELVVRNGAISAALAGDAAVPAAGESRGDCAGGEAPPDVPLEAGLPPLAEPGVPADAPGVPASVPGVPPPVPGVPAPVPGVPPPVPGVPPPVPGVPAPVPGVPAPVPGVPAAVPGVPAPVPGVPRAVPRVAGVVAVMLAGDAPEDCPWDAAYLAAPSEAAVAATSADPAPKDTVSTPQTGHEGNSDVYNI